jgi:hypothetical protein
MMRALAMLLSAVIAGCATAPQANNRPSGSCYTESGYLDSTNGCSIREGYPDCYLVCPDAGTRTRVGQGTENPAH